MQLLTTAFGCATTYSQSKRYPDFFDLVCQPLNRPNIWEEGSLHGYERGYETQRWVFFQPEEFSAALGRLWVRRVQPGSVSRRLRPDHREQWRDRYGELAAALEQSWGVVRVQSARQAI